VDAQKEADSKVPEEEEEELETDTEAPDLKEAFLVTSMQEEVPEEAEEAEDSDEVASEDLPLKVLPLLKPKYLLVSLGKRQAINE
jgi:hypothetical protein